MVPTKAQALQILQEAEAESPKNQGWVRHSIIIGDIAAVITESLNRNSQELDAEKVRILGYLHDVGKKVGPKPEHPYNGYRFMQSLGFDEEYCQISLAHSFVNNDPYCNFGNLIKPERDEFLIDFVRDHHFTIEEKLITLCDHMVTTKVMRIDERIVDIMSRYGAGENAPARIHAVQALKAEFDNLLGHDLYELFPEIKKNR